jgi:hypothetical protein
MNQNAIEIILDKSRWNCSSSIYFHAKKRSIAGEKSKKLSFIHYLIEAKKSSGNGIYIRE